MESGLSRRLVGSEIHGFHTLQDLDVRNTLEEAKMRWLRPNEIHAILCNHNYFSISVKPVHVPKSGSVILFDRKMLRNFRKDGHNWKKKKDGKTVKEAHEHLKVGNEERIHVYYAHGLDNPTFVRRCYWLLDKTLEHIVLVHYRETKELQGSPATPVNSTSSSVTDQSTPWPVSEEFDSGAGHAYYAGPDDNSTVKNHEMTLHEINTLEWDELLLNNDSRTFADPESEKVSCFDWQNKIDVNGAISNGTPFSTNNLPAQNSLLDNLTNQIAQSDNILFNVPDEFCGQPIGNQVVSNMQKRDSGVVGTFESSDVLVNDGLQSQDSFRRWMNCILADSPGSQDDRVLDSSISSDHNSFMSPEVDHHPEPLFNITDVSPAWAYSTEKTKILITGLFQEGCSHLAESNLLCVCGDVCFPAETVQVGVYRIWISPHSPGQVNLYMSIDGHKPISQVLEFEYRLTAMHNSVVPPEGNPKWEEFQFQKRLAHLLFSTSKSLNILSSKVSPNALQEANKFACRTSHISNHWTYLSKLIEENRISFAEAKDGLFEITLKSRLKEWLLERVVEGRKTTEYDVQGLGVIHLCAILGYTWAVHLFASSGLSLDFRDKRGWTALHWAAYHGREKMVATLLSAGAKPNLVSDPTSENPGGRTAADLAYKNGYEGLAAYLSEKALVAQFKDMTIAGNISGSLQTSRTETMNTENLSEEELYMKDTLAAYRTVADAAARIQVAFREHSLKVQTKAVQFSNPEDEARNIVAAMKIQHAFRNYDTKKRMVAAARIQHRFRSWKIRREFLNMRHQAIKIQAAFRGFQVRRQYRKIIWSVGVLEKAILRWRLKRKGFRGLHTDSVEAEEKQESDTEEDFYRTSRKQAEERVERAVVTVQTMFRSKKAQQEYRRMKLAHNEAELEYENLLDPDTDMGS